MPGWQSGTSLSGALCLLPFSLFMTDFLKEAEFLDLTAEATFSIKGSCLEVSEGTEFHLALASGSYFCP